MAQQPKHWMNETDIGSGEKTPGQEDVEREERALGASRLDANTQDIPDGNESTAAGRVLQNGDHLARIQARKMPDDTYEAQIYVRLTREPETAETYIPAGTFPSEEQAWAAAEERAKRAFRENEF
ncbi:MAG TPA: hypothetical protein VFF81_00770 [Noviherbaspirillum sp.]|nr:hypothetical protein [Noviherbaspirillum sp.]